MIDQTGVQSETFEITGMVQPLLGRPAAERGQARRQHHGPRAHDRAVRPQRAPPNGLVVGTGNKTEILLGYSTLYGDSASALNPLGDLYKTQLRQLARHAGRARADLDKAPSADLWRARPTRASWASPMRRWTSCCTCWSTSATRPPECVAAGFERGVRQAVTHRIRRNQFKRMLPLIAKLSNRTVGYDFLVPARLGHLDDMGRRGERPGGGEICMFRQAHA